MDNPAFNAGKPWTQEQYQQLKDDYQAGLTLQEIVQRYGRSGSAIIAKLVYLGVLVPLRDGHYYPISETPMGDVAGSESGGQGR